GLATHLNAALRGRHVDVLLIAARVAIEDQEACVLQIAGRCDFHVGGTDAVRPFVAQLELPRPPAIRGERALRRERPFGGRFVHAFDQIQRTRVLTPAGHRQRRAHRKQRDGQRHAELTSHEVSWAGHAESSLASRSACPVAPISVKSRYSSRSSRSRPSWSPLWRASSASSTWTSGSNAFAPVSRASSSARASDASIS